MTPRCWARVSRNKDLIPVRILRCCSLLLLLCALSANSLMAAATSKHKPPSTRTKKKSSGHKPIHIGPTRAQRMKAAFIASADLRPMAVQLLENRSPQAYAGVEKYAD